MSSLCEILFGSKKQEGIFSVCTANPVVIRSALRLAKEEGFTLAVEATANQVDQFGGYTGMRPADYAAMVEAIAADEGVLADRYILGGDHLGPLTRCGEPEEKAMPFAKELVRQYVLAGFTKIHLDTSMRLASDDQQIPLDVRVCARRGADLAEVVWQAYAERVKSAPSSSRPSLVIGSEVPIPGGSKEHEDSVAPTDPKDFLAQVQAFQEAFSAHGVSFEDVVAFVVQPGVEFGDDFVCQYSPQKAAGLMAALTEAGRLVFEGHSTDYQTKDSLQSLVKDRVAILKVGPALTFALREALFLTELALGDMGVSCPPFRETLYAAMKGDDRYWRKYYTGTPDEVNYKLLFSYSDRCRYYLPFKEVSAAENAIMSCTQSIPDALLSLYFPRQYSRYMAGRLSPKPADVIMDRVADVLRDYAFGCNIIQD